MILIRCVAEVKPQVRFSASSVFASGGQQALLNAYPFRPGTRGEVLAYPLSLSTETFSFTGTGT